MERLWPSWSHENGALFKKSPKDGIVKKILFSEDSLVEGQVELIIVEKIKNGKECEDC